MKTKSEIGSRLPIRRGIVEAEAAMYVGIGVSKFRELVKAEIMPRPRLLDGARAYDVTELDAAFFNCPREGGDENQTNSWADSGNQDKSKDGLAYFREGSLQMETFIKAEPAAGRATESPANANGRK